MSAENTLQAQLILKLAEATAQLERLGKATERQTNATDKLAGAAGKMQDALTKAYQKSTDGADKASKATETHEDRVKREIAALTISRERAMAKAEAMQRLGIESTKAASASEMVGKALGAQLKSVVLSTVGITAVASVIRGMLADYKQGVDDAAKSTVDFANKSRAVGMGATPAMRRAMREAAPGLTPEAGMEALDAYVGQGGKRDDASVRRMAQIANVGTLLGLEPKTTASLLGKMGKAGIPNGEDLIITLAQEHGSKAEAAYDKMGPLGRRALAEQSQGAFGRALKAAPLEDIDYAEFENRNLAGALAYRQSTDAASLAKKNAELRSKLGPESAVQFLFRKGGGYSFLPAGIAKSMAQTEQGAFSGQAPTIDDLTPEELATRRAEKFESYRHLFDESPHRGELAGRRLPSVRAFAPASYEYALGILDPLINSDLAAETQRRRLFVGPTPAASEPEVLSDGATIPAPGVSDGPNTGTPTTTQPAPTPSAPAAPLRVIIVDDKTRRQAPQK